MAREVAEVPASIPERAANRLYYGYYLIGAAFIAQFVSIGSQNYMRMWRFFKPIR